MQFKQIARSAAIEHVAGIGHRGLMLRRSLDIGLGQPPAGAQAQVQFGFVENRRQACLGGTNVSRQAAFVGGQRPGAGELDQEQVVLHQVSPKRRLAQRAFAHLPHEIVIDIAIPLAGAGGFEAIENIHAHASPSYTASKKASSRATVRR
ncbi:hypothetical protein D3C80_1193930 [compost metagenome]